MAYARSLLPGCAGVASQLLSECQGETPCGRSIDVGLDVRYFLLTIVQSRISRLLKPAKQLTYRIETLTL